MDGNEMGFAYTVFERFVFMERLRLMVGMHGM
jgi:hypothetical protein